MSIVFVMKIVSIFTQTNIFTLVYVMLNSKVTNKITNVLLVIRN
jgi:hypothetical protein